jgi:catechol O-methyltransferase
MLYYVLGGVAAVFVVHELAGRPIPFLRWSFLQIPLNGKKMFKEWQVGDGREEAVAQYVAQNAPAGDRDAVIAAIDHYAYKKKFLINVGDVKGGILDAALDRTQPKRVLELGAYVGYSALRMTRHLPQGGCVYSVEFNPSNADISRRVIAHAGASTQAKIVTGSLGDGGATVKALETEHGFAKGNLDFVFIDHAKEVYLQDLKIIQEAGWLHEGSVVVADNVGFPGAPDYKAYMEQQEGKLWRTVTHKTKVEYQKMIPDLVLESTLISSSK